MTENERQLLMLLQMLDTPGAYNKFVAQNAPQPEMSMDVRRIMAMGGDAARAYQDFMSAIDAGKSYEQARSAFTDLVGSGTYVLDPDTADMITKTALDSIAAPSDGTSPVIELFKDLGAPELAMLAPTARKKNQAPNPYRGLAREMVGTAKQYQVAPKDMDTRLGMFRSAVPERPTTWSSRQAMLDYMEKIRQNPQVYDEANALERAQEAQTERVENRKIYREAYNKAYRGAGGGPRVNDYDVARAQMLSLILGR